MHLLQTHMYNDISVEFEKVDNELYANATLLCKAYGQLVSEWLRLPQTKRYMQALRESAENPLALTFRRLGGIGGGGSTWIHEKLLLNLVMWLDLEFSVWCDLQIFTLLREGSVSLSQTRMSYVDQLRALAEQLDEQERMNA